MTGPWTKSVIAGVAELPPTRTSAAETTLGLIGRVGRRALDDASMKPADIDGLFVGPHVGETPQHVPATVAEYLGLTPDVAGLVDLGGATGAGMVWRAAAAIEAGMCSVALCVLANTRVPDRPVRAPNRNPIREFDVPYGASGANVAYAIITNRHMAEFGTTAEQLALIAVKERDNAQHNPDAVWNGSPITVADVLASPMIAEPIHLLEAVMPCAGGAAVVVASAERARRSRQVRLRGAAEKVTHRAVSQMPDLTSSPFASSAVRAMEVADVTVDDVDLWSLYDCYPVVVGMTLEAFGVCPKGSFGPFLEERDFTPKGLPLNTHGGQLGCGQADLAGGMGHIVEAVRQLRGEAAGRQVPSCDVAVVTGNGATMSEVTVLVLEASG